MTEPSSEIDTSKDYYAVLGLPQTAEISEIKRTYKRLALKVHPDHNPEHEKTEAHNTFCKIQEAYEILSDPVKKALCDDARPHNNRGPSNRGTSVYPTTRESKTPLWRQNQPQRYHNFTAPKAKANNGAPTTAAEGKRRAPDPPPRRTASRQSAGASFGSSNNGFDPRKDESDEPPAKFSNYCSPDKSSRYASTPIPDASPQAPPPVPQRPSPAVKTGPPDTVSPHTMDKGNSTPTTSLPPHQPTEFMFPQPAQTMSSHHPSERLKQRQQPAESKQSSSTIPMPSAGQDTNDEGQSDNTPNADEKRPGKPETLSNLDEAGSGDAREFHEVSALSFPTPPTDTGNFDKYLAEWNLFKIEIIGHYVARIEAITKLQNSRSDNIQQYYEWLVQDDDVLGLFIEAVEEHEKQFRKFIELFEM
ncbi:molecular chaperone DnaJ [Fusarium oxysporum f. sp. raphani 54005]|uniref:Molecular chaperone DnaJ n=3 Tax=Fusarium oxysporum TaxID=5507 RepID=X0CCW8_FUSOX|nr:molecular chaperone DnaJ [Fusarium oxysporum f. sp. raphani 54005]KAG7423493.1 Chaperone protein DnaJ [Fusarium oxysporum f. sp. raphani]RYC80930.1 hypothetical protein BFJ63_vAg16171 [Fusarium oxysporum f. sp. narcissi]